VLLLFDIDGTLLDSATDAHRVALDVAIKEVHRVDPAGLRAKVGPAGRTDGEIARLILLDLGVSAVRIDERADAVCEACARVYAEICPPDLSSHVVPGMPSVLDWASGRNSTTLGLVTGNFEAVGRLKLARAGLGKWFASAPGAFGSDSEDRAALPAIARRRAGHASRAETIVIGDTPRDIACARADGLRCVAVTTGWFGADELSGADAVAADTDELLASLVDMGI
jgi:phosphoglycolate phosphatase-like HAD superfamily hydrolase